MFTRPAWRSSEAGPAGLACREELLKHGIDTIVIDNHDTIGGQVHMQIPTFSFFEKEKKLAESWF
jgi:NADPH-dependent glutamate synthase beta subunit-like oxidoreductase